MDHNTLRQMLNDLRPLEVLHLMNLAGKERISLQEKLIALVAYLDHVGVLIKSDKGEYEISGRNRCSLGLRGYEEKALDMIVHGEPFFLGNMLLDLNLNKFHINIGTLKNRYFWCTKTDKFYEVVKIFLSLRDALKRHKAGGFPIKSKLEPYLYAFPSIILEDDEYVIWAKKICREHSQIYAQCIMSYPYH